MATNAERLALCSAHLAGIASCLIVLLFKMYVLPVCRDAERFVVAFAALLDYMREVSRNRLV